MLLVDTPTGNDVHVLASHGESPAMTRRLAEMGLRAGTVLRIQSRTSGGGAILAIGDDRIAVSRAILRGITVAPAPDSAVTHG
jgi:Fe2+ transport system protein FeoA